MAARLGDDVALMSRVGADTLGELALARLGAFPLERRLIQRDGALPTGQVTVAVKEGQPEYVIHEPAAWDAFELTEEWKTEAGEADAVCFGSLAQRHAESREAVLGVVRAMKPGALRIFDVNLRAPFFSAEVVRASLKLATVLKLNDGEMPQVLEMLGLPLLEALPLEQLRLGAERLMETFPGLTMVAVTRGGEGSLLVGREEWDYHRGIATEVVDTVGAGDAFTAALTHYLLRGAPMKTLNEAGNRWGSFVASRMGAMPEMESERVREIVRAIEGA